MQDRRVIRRVSHWSIRKIEKLLKGMKKCERAKQKIKARLDRLYLGFGWSQHIEMQSIHRVFHEPIAVTLNVHNGIFL